MKKSTSRIAPDREECLNMARNCASANLRRTERLVTRHYDSYLEVTGVTAVQLPMLAMISSAEEPTFRLMTETMELDRSTLSRNLNLLQRLGLIEIGQSSGPKPGLLKLTPKGRRVLTVAHEQWKRAHRELMKLVKNDAYAEGLVFLRQLRRSARGRGAKAAH